MMLMSRFQELKNFGEYVVLASGISAKESSVVIGSSPHLIFADVHYAHLAGSAQGSEIEGSVRTTRSRDGVRVNVLDAVKQHFAEAFPFSTWVDSGEVVADVTRIELDDRVMSLPIGFRNGNRLVLGFAVNMDVVSLALNVPHSASSLVFKTRRLD